MEFRARSIIFKDEEGKREYEELVGRANSGDADAQAMLTYIDALTERLEAGDCYKTAHKKAEAEVSRRGFKVIFSSKWEELLFEHWKYGEWLRKTSFSRSKPADVLNEVANKVCLPPVVAFPLVFLLSDLFDKVGFDPDKIMEHRNPLVRFSGMLGAWALMVYTWIGIGITILPATPFALASHICEKSFERKQVLPRP